jgi:uncharacterized protein (TIGR00270 family)
MAEKLSGVVIDGSFLLVCHACREFGKKPLAARPKEERLFEESPEMIKDFGRRLKALRDRRRISQVQLADAIHEDVAVIKGAEKGKQPPEKTIRKLEKYFKCGLIDHRADRKVSINMDRSRRRGLSLGDIAEVRKR